MNFECVACGLVVPMDAAEFPLSCACGTRYEAATDPAPSLPAAFKNYSQALAKWTIRGMPTRDEDESALYLEICKPCRHYQHGTCSKCACNLSESGAAFRSKLKMATETCPINRWPIRTDCVTPVRPASQARGSGVHLSGWPHVLEAIHKQAGGHLGILLDDFVEQTFAYKGKPKVYDRPWVGIFHHPAPPVAYPFVKHSVDTVLRRPAFLRSSRWLKMAIALSSHLADYLRTRLDCPVIALRHPIDLESHKMWNWAKYAEQPTLLQVGWFLRNVRALARLPRIERIRKIRVLPRPTAELYSERIQATYPSSELMVMDACRLSAADYHEALTRCVLFQEFFGASANNVILEAIASATPVIVNRHPAVEEYLGWEYPLYFDEYDDVPQLLERSRLEHAHAYLRDLDKGDLRVASFTGSLLEAVEGIELA